MTGRLRAGLAFVMGALVAGLAFSLFSSSGDEATVGHHDPDEPTLQAPTEPAPPAPALSGSEAESAGEGAPEPTLDDSAVAPAATPGPPERETADDSPPPPPPPALEPSPEAAAPPRPDRGPVPRPMTPPPPPPVPADDVSEAADSDEASVRGRVRQGFRQLIPELRECYELLLALEPEASDRLIFDLVVERDPDDEESGVTQLEAIRSGNFVVEDLECFAEVVAGIQMPPPADDGVLRITYPIVLSTGNSPEE